MFQLNTHATEIKSHTARKEHHGDRLVLASTLSCETVCPSSILDEFDPAIRPLLYRKPDKGENPQAEIPMDVQDGLTARRLPHIKPLVLDAKFPGYKLAVESGIKAKDLIEQEKVEVSKIVFEALEGGSVRISFNLSFQVGWMNSGKLNHLIQETVDLTLTPPTAEEQQDPQADLTKAA
jgi:hypothetical protein